MLKHDRFTILDPNHLFFFALGHPLFNLAMHLFQKHNLITTLDLDVLKLMRLCSKYSVKVDYMMYMMYTSRLKLYTISGLHLR